MLKTLIDDLKALLARIEADIAPHRTQGQAAANVKAAVTALEAHPDAPEVADASSAAAAPANDGSEAVTEPAASGATA